MGNANDVVIPGPAAKGRTNGKVEKKVKSFNPLKLDEETLRQLGITICDEIDQSEVGKGTLPDRWKLNKELYDINPNATNLILVEGTQAYPIPLWKPKADKIIGTVFKSITGTNTYVQIQPRSEDVKDKEKTTRLEKALMMMATSNNGKFGFDRAFRQCLKIAVNTCIAFLYMYVTEEGEVKFEPIAPEDFCVYSHELGDLNACKTIGHKFYQYISVIKDKFRIGKYLTDRCGGGDVVGQRGSQEEEFAGVTQTPTVVPDDELIECWQLVRNCDLGEGLKDYTFVVSKQTQAVLFYEEHIYKTNRRYFPIQFDEDYGSLWPYNSPGQEMQGFQLIFSDLLNVLIQGGYMNAWGAVLLSGVTLKSKVTRLEPGMVIEGPENARAQNIGIPFNGQYLVDLIPIIEKLSDLLSRVTPLGMGQPLPAHTSATAAAGMLQSQQEGQDQYTSFIAPVVAQVWQGLAEFLSLHYPEVTEFYGNLGLQDAMDLEVPSKYIPTGKSGSNNPIARQQQFGMLLTMASQPTSGLDYRSVEKAAVENSDLPFDTVGLFKSPGPSPQEILQVMAGLLSGQVPPQEAMQYIKQAAQQLGPPPGSPEGDASGNGQPANTEGGSGANGQEFTNPAPSGDFAGGAPGGLA
jgi:hypothetical protein